MYWNFYFLKVLVDPSKLPPPDIGGNDKQHINPTVDDDNQLIKESTQLGYRNPPVNNVTEEKPLDIKALPPPDYGESDEFASVTQHINPSSHYDDDDDENQLIKDCTLLGYHSPPEAKSQVKPSNLQPRADPTGYPPGGYRSLEWVTPTTSLPSEHAVASPNRDDKFDHTHLEVSRQGQHQHVDARRLGNELGYGNTRPPNMTPAAIIPGDIAKAGGLRSLPSVTVSTSANANQFGSSPRMYKRQASIPNDGSLSGGSERMAAVSTGTTTNSNQLGVSDSNAVLTAAVPIIDQPTPVVSDGKFGKTNLNALKKRLQHKKEVTQTGTTKPVAGKIDLTSLRSKLEKVKEVREKPVVAGSVSKSPAADNYSMAEIESYISENLVTIKNPHDKKPMANPRTMTPANLASSNTHSGSSTSTSKITYRLWQCANCQTINEVHYTACEHCKLPPGRMADRSTFCDFCQMMIFIPLRRDFKDTVCPRCMTVQLHVFHNVI